MSSIYKRKYLLAGLCFVLFIAAQTFQEVAYRFWIPASHGPQDDLAASLVPIDRTRAILIMSTIGTLIVRRGRYYYFAPAAFGLNALRLTGRLLSYAGQRWLDSITAGTIKRI